MIVSGAYLSQMLSLLFVSEMCVFVSRPIDIATFVGGKRWPLQNDMLIFLEEKDTFRKTWKSSMMWSKIFFTTTTANLGIRRRFFV